MPHGFDIWLDSFSYYCREHPQSILAFVLLALILYALITGLNLLRRIARSLERK